MMLLVPVVNGVGEFTKSANIYSFRILMSKATEVTGSKPPFVDDENFALAIAKVNIHKF